MNIKCVKDISMPNWLVMFSRSVKIAIRFSSNVIPPNVKKLKRSKKIIFF